MIVMTEGIEGMEHPSGSSLARVASASAESNAHSQPSQVEHADHLLPSTRCSVHLVVVKFPLPSILPLPPLRAPSLPEMQTFPE